MQTCERETEQRLQNECTRPKLVIAACIIWIIEGCIDLLSVAFLVVGVVLSAHEGDSSALVVLLSAPVIGLFGCAFIYVSIQTYRGKARDTLGNGIGSLTLGLLFTLQRVIFSMSGEPRRMNGEALFIGAPLLLAGILALLGRTRYKAWREMQNANRAAEKTT